MTPYVALSRLPFHRTWTFDTEIKHWTFVSYTGRKEE